MNAKSLAETIAEADPLMEALAEIDALLARVAELEACQVELLRIGVEAGRRMEREDAVTHLDQCVAYRATAIEAAEMLEHRKHVGCAHIAMRDAAETA